MTDVVVLGGGIVGCAVAYELARRGAAVTLVDPRGIGLGASRASAGMLVPYSEGRHDAVMQALGVRGLEAYERLMQELDPALVGYTRRGSIDVALDEGGAANLRAWSADLTREGVAHELLEGADARSALPNVTTRAVAALRIHTHGAVGVPELTRELWRRAETRGARVVTASALRVKARSGGVEVETSSGVLRAGHVVCAAGSWSSGLEIEGAERLPVRPVRGQLLVLRDSPLPMLHNLWGPRCYVVPRAGGVLLVGATVEEAGFDERATAAGARELLDAACELLPTAATAAFGEMRVGLRPATPDERPIIGASSRVEGLFYATGHYRNGALLAPLTGKVVADALEGRIVDPLLGHCSPLRFGAL